MAGQTLTQDCLKEILHYQPSTGRFTWKRRRGRMKAGSTAGTYDHLNRLNITISKRQYKAHRLAWLYVYGRWPVQVDHVNHCQSDNRLSNLREVSNQENHKNKSLSKKNTSGVTGVTWHKGAGKWCAQIMVNGESKYLGLFEKKSDAAMARERANREYGFHKNHGVAI